MDRPRQIVLVLQVAVCLATAQAASTTRSVSAAEPVAATVNGQPILHADVTATVASVVQGRPLGKAELQRLKAEALEQLISRVLVEGIIAPWHAKPEEVDAALARIKLQLTQRKSTLEKMLAERGLTEAQLKKQLDWQIGWERYLAEHMTDDKLRQHFEDHKRHFDGSERRVSHILLRPDSASTTTAKLIEEGGKLRDEIVGGKVTFEKAAERHSAGPSRSKGGDLGFISRRAPMVEPFSRAAFDLAAGEVSQPVATPFGVHLIRVTEEKPGSKTFEDVRDDLRPPVAADMFEQLAAAERTKAKIAYAADAPRISIPTKPQSPPKAAR